METHGRRGVAIDELARLPSRKPDYEAEATAIAELLRAFSTNGHDALRALGDVVVSIGLAESAAVSLRLPDGACDWRVASESRAPGAFERLPCPPVAEWQGALLFRAPVDAFPTAQLAPDLAQILVAPLHIDGVAAAAIWAMSSRAGCAFEHEDARLLERLATLAATMSQPTPLHQALDGMSQLVWRADGSGRWTWAGPQWTRLTGQPPSQSRGYGWLDSLHPDDRRLARRAWRSTPDMEPFDLDHRICDPAAASYRWFRTRAIPIRDGTGGIIEWLGVSTDIHDLKSADDRDKALRWQFDHRARNMLALVRSIARRTAENSDSVESFQMHFEGRLSAFTRLQSFTHDPEDGIDLESLIAEEMLANQAREGDRVTIAGPPVRLVPRVADLLGLAIHELAVNAVKYGGLSSDLGRVAVTWRMEEAPQANILALTWFDGAPGRPTAPPTHQGFGTELIERSLVYDLDAVTSLDFAPEGVHCTIRLPLPDRTATND